MANTIVILSRFFSTILVPAEVLYMAADIMSDIPVPLPECSKMNTTRPTDDAISTTTVIMSRTSTCQPSLTTSQKTDDFEITALGDTANKYSNANIVCASIVPPVRSGGSARAANQTSRLSPVHSSGGFRPIISSRVGEISASLPPRISLNLRPCPYTSINGTGDSVCAV